MTTFVTRYMRVALLVVGSAILLFSCDEQAAKRDAAAEAAMMTEYSEHLSIVMSQNGRRSYFFETPLVEGYTLGAEPYREFRRGIKITTYQDDSLATVDAVLTANYAIYYEKRELWEAKGDVEVHKFDGTEVYTQQLFWNARTKKVYSNVDTKLVKGNNQFVGERFESDEDFKDWRFYYQKSRMEVNVAPGEGSDSTAVAAAPAVEPERTDPPHQEELTVQPMPLQPAHRVTQRERSVKKRPVREALQRSEHGQEARPIRLEEPAKLE